jgi:hypothetical protein
MNKPARLLAAIALASITSAASATTLTYSFTGATAGSYQEISSYAYNSTNLITTNTLNQSANSATGSMSFTLNSSRYTDSNGASGATYFSTSHAALPWLNSNSTVSGPLLAGNLDTSGTVNSSLHAYTSACGCEENRSLPLMALSSPVSTGTEEIRMASAYCFAA